MNLARSASATLTLSFEQALAFLLLAMIAGFVLGFLLGHDFRSDR
jgi:hypothetical protein